MRHATCFFFILGLMGAVPASANDRPNVLWIAVDDFWPYIGRYGDTQVKTPNIDRLARDGMLFNRAYAQMAQCWPSRNMVFSGCRSAFALLGRCVVDPGYRGTENAQRATLSICQA